MIELRAPLPGLVGQWLVSPGDRVARNDPLVLLEAMKMEHEVRSPVAARVRECFFATGEPVRPGEVLLVLEEDGAAPPPAPSSAPAPATAPAPVHPPAAPAAPGPAGEVRGPVRGDLQRVLERQAFTQDAARPDAVARRHALGLRTARENVADLCDPGSFDEIGALAVAAQRSRRSEDDLVRNTPADGMVTGIANVNGALFGPERSRTVVLAYDATVLAGTQGFRNHQKTDRLLALAHKQRLPVVLFAEGGGGRPGDTDMPIVAGLHLATFASFARLNGVVPLVGIAAGRCFAGNAALLGCCDVIIATRGSNIGMGGPAMIEGGGLGVVAPEAIGPAPVQARNGVIDVLVDNESEAVAAARRYLGFFQGTRRDWQAPDPLALRELVPENRRRAYDSRAVLAGIADLDSLLELRAGFGQAVHTALGRLEGRPVGFLASNPLHLGGAIDAEAADKAARFLQLCNAHGLPVVSLVDTPGFMVGPAIEEQAQVRHVSRIFLAAARLRVPFFAVVLRKGYGLGAMALAAGGFHEPDGIVSWPSGEFGGMGLEGAVRLGYRKELEAVPEGPEREALFEQLVARHYAAGQAINMAATLEIDGVIDPAQTRAWLVRGLAGSRLRPLPQTLGVDSW